jgi:hypothetical protein
VFEPIKSWEDEDEEIESADMKKRSGMWKHHDWQYGDEDQHVDNGAFSSYM